MENYNGMIELFFKTSYGSGLSVCIFVALCLCVLGCLLQGPIRLKVQWGRRGGLQPPPNFGQLRFFGQQEKIWAKPGFKDVSMFFYYYFEEINILYFNLTKFLTSA